MKNTTPESCEIHRLPPSWWKMNVTAGVMEVSSRGIALRRTADIFLISAFFSEHRTLDHIGKGNMQLFRVSVLQSRLMRQCGTWHCESG